MTRDEFIGLKIDDWVYRNTDGKFRRVVSQFCSEPKDDDQSLWTRPLWSDDFGCDIQVKDHALWEKVGKFDDLPERAKVDFLFQKLTRVESEFEEFRNRLRY